MSIINSTAIPNGAKAFEIDQSLRFEPDRDTRLVRTPTTNGNRRTFTLSVWLKRGNLTSSEQEQDIIGAFYASNASRYSYISFDDADRISIFGGEYSTSSTPRSFWRKTKARYRDSSAWYHIVWRHDSTDGNAANRDILYVNGVLQDWDTGFSNDLVVGQNEYSFFNYTTAPMTIGEYASTNSSSSMEFDGYMGEMNWIDGTSVAPTSFGETGDYGEWKPIEYSGSYGTNGFYLPFKQDYTVEGFSAVTYKGSAAKHYIGGVGFSSNLVWTKSTSTDGKQHILVDSIRGGSKNLMPDSAEVENSSANRKLTLGAADGYVIDSNSGHLNESDKTYVSWNWDMGSNSYGHASVLTANGNAKHSTSQNKIGASSIYFDGSGDYINVSNNEKWEVGTSDFTIEMWAKIATNSSNFSGLLTMGDTQVSLRLNSQGRVQFLQDHGGTRGNTSDGDTNGTNLRDNAWHHVAVVRHGTLWNLYVDGTSEYSGTGMSGDIDDIDVVHIGKRTDSSSDHFLNGYLDEIRMSRSARYTSNFTAPTVAFINDPNTLLLVHSNTSNNSTTFTDSAGARINSNGNITSYVEANPTYGQSIVSWTGNATAGATVGHGLSSAPDMIIIRNRPQAVDWTVYHDSLATDWHIKLHSANAAANSSTRFNSTDPSSTVFTLGQQDDANGSSKAMIAYCWHSVSGYSKFASYTGTGSTHAVTLGFAPAFLMIKCSDVAHPWVMLDNTRQAGTALKYEIYADTTAAEGTDASGVLFTSTGFQLTTDNSYVNQNTKTFIYMAFADKREYAYWLDQSGNNNDWTSNNLTESDIMVDSPTNNFATMNPLFRGMPSTGDVDSAHTLSEGNLKMRAAGNKMLGTTIVPTSDKWYAEFYVNAQSTYGPVFGWVNNEYTQKDLSTNTGLWKLYSRGAGDQLILYPESASSVTLASAALHNGDIIQFAWDCASGKAWIGRNNIWYNASLGTTGNPATGANPTITTTVAKITNDFTPYIASSDDNSTVTLNFGQDSSFAGVKTAQGNQDDNDIGDFYYTPPSGFKALCTKSLASPTVIPSAHFNTVLYTGTGGTHPSTTQSVTGVGFEPSWTWIKIRSQAYQHFLYDAVRGATKVMYSDSTAAEATGNQMTSFNSDGFTVANISSGTATNKSGDSFVAWNWKADTTPSKTYAVTVVSDSGNKYRFDGFGTSAVALDLKEGGTYKFDQSHSSNSAHPLRFSTTSNGSHGGGSEYTTGVTTNGTPGSSGAYTQIIVASGAATLYYYCTNHSNMGGQANTNSTSGSSNFSGSIQSNNSANVDAGFSISTYTGNAVEGATVGHGLSKTPEVIIVKKRNAAGTWATYHHKNTSEPETDYLILNGNEGTSDSANIWNDTAPTSSVFSLGNNAVINGNTNTFVAYCFHSVDGYSKMGSYVGNLSAGSSGQFDGTFVYLGFRPKFLLFKRTDGSARWYMFDSVRNSVNEVRSWLDSESNAAEASTQTGGYETGLDFLSNGFKLKGPNGGINSSGKTYVYIAFAEMPFSHSNAR